MMVAMTSQATKRHFYAVTAERDGPRWFQRVDELPGAFSQVRRLDTADGMARDANAAFLDVAPDSFDMAIEVRLSANLQRDVAGVVDLRNAIDPTEREYAQRTLRLATRLVKSEGMTVREVGHLLGLSYQRVSQLVAGP